ncbi:hypothetical protein LRH25_12850 [Ideonella azotifigens]|uniref:Uncharacterized protein n=1 Tax=Ideonella azotifigens TaxID=513160 RepID=A0ABP3V9N5_9BURK|nr:hypothetical protein [Ideonella azotifigens]MCD2341230.1 hypothetical protein [Ideonella azotifigens]
MTPISEVRAGVATACFELLYESLHGGRGFSFPCNAGGEVEIDQLSDNGRRFYLVARALVGSEYAIPRVRPVLPRDPNA